MENRLNLNPNDNASKLFRDDEHQYFIENRKLRNPGERIDGKKSEEIQRIFLQHKHSTKHEKSSTFLRCLFNYNVPMFNPLG